MAELIAHDFAATLISRDEYRSSYEVQGFVTCPTAGYGIELEPTSEGRHSAGRCAHKRG